MTELLAMIKPWAFGHRNDIIDRLHHEGREIQSAEVYIPEKLLRFLYGHYEGQPFYEPMILDMMNREGVITIYEGNMAVFNELKTKIREKFDPLLPKNPDANAKIVGYTRNSIHISDSLESAEREVKFTREMLKKIPRLVPHNGTWQGSMSVMDKLRWCMPQ